MNLSEQNNQYKFYTYPGSQNESKKNKTENNFNEQINKKTSRLFLKITENVVQLIVGSLTFISGLAWNNYLMKNHIINNNLMYPLGITIVTSLLIILLSYFHIDPNQ